MSRVEIDLCVHVKRVLPEPVAVCCCRIVQESLRNIAKHAAARHVQIHAEVVGEIMMLLIADDGIGVDGGN